MDKVNDLFMKASSPSLNYKMGDLYFSPSYLQAGLIVFLLFLLVLTFARLRRLYLQWSLKGALSMVFVGFFLALIIEGFFLIGGRTMLTELLGWKNPPKPISVALDAGREKLVNVLGTTSEVPSSKASEPLTPSQLLEEFMNLTSSDQQAVKTIICKPNNDK
jgi:hypothetical protein